MARYFWYTYHDLPDGVGFSHFGFEHLTALALIALGIAVCCFAFRRLGERGRDRMLKAVALLTVGGEIAKDSVLFAVGHLDMEYLPLHLCSFSIAVFPAHAFMRDCRLKNALGELAWCPLLAGSICALLFPNWTAYPMLSFMNLHSFIWHGLLVLYPALLMTGDRISPTLRHWWYPVVFFLIVVPPILAFDMATGYNYFFVNYPLSGTPLVWLYDLMGPFWRVGFAACALVVVLVMLACTQWHCARKERKAREKQKARTT